MQAANIPSSTPPPHPMSVVDFVWKRVYNIPVMDNLLCRLDPRFGDLFAIRDRCLHACST